MVVTITSAGLVNVYADGRLAGSGQSAALRNVTRTSYFLGKSDYPSDSNWGSIDEAAIYNKILTADQISTHYLAGIGAGRLSTATTW